MELIAQIELDKHLTKGKFYRVIDSTEKEYTVINNSGVRYSYPKSCFAQTFSKSMKEDLGGVVQTNSEINNGGSTDYYKIDPSWKMCQDIIEARNMSFSQGNICKAAFTFNVGRHGGTDELREINKIIYFANRIKEEILKEREND